MPLDDLVSVIATLQQRIATHRQSLQQNETRTRTALIYPLLTALGWDVSDPALVTPEYSVSGKRADYALLGDNGLTVFLEAKICLTNLWLTTGRRSSLTPANWGLDSQH